MAGSSNRDLWQVLTGHSALRDHALIEREWRDALPRLREGVAYYAPPSSGAEKRLRSGGKVKGNKLSLVLDISTHLQLDQEQSLELFEGYLLNAHRGELSELEDRVRGEGGRREVVRAVTSYYQTERLHLLRCLKHMFGFWQDPNHPFRDVYSECVGEITKDEKTFITALWKQYQISVETDLPRQLSSSEEKEWVFQRLIEQVELLKIILLYYKDFIHCPDELVGHAHQLWESGCGLRQACLTSLVDGTDHLLQHISHLCSLILVESFDLDSILVNLEDPSALDEHHLLQSDSSTNVQRLDDLFSEWGDQDCHTPILLAWALLNFVRPESSHNLEGVRLLGNRALSGGVFRYLQSLLSSNFFSQERPVSGVCRSVVHTLLSLALSQFSEDSLGEHQDLVTIATLTLTHPPLRLQFWQEGLSSGTGLLLSSALAHFPWASSSLSALLLSLAGDQVSAGQVCRLLLSLSGFTEQLPHREMGNQVKVVTGDEGENPALLVVKARSLYTSEAQWLGLRGIVMATGARGEVWEGWGGEELVTWPVSSLSGWDLLALETARLLHTSPLGSSTKDLVARVTSTVRLATEMMKSDWSLAIELQRISSQTFSILQRFAALPQPPCTLLASAISCIAVMATRNTAETWSALGRTGFLPFLTSSHPHSLHNFHCLTVGPGHYGNLLKMVECPDGCYPVTMAMLDLLATTCLPGNSEVSREQLACVTYLMREVFTSCHKWKFKVCSDRHQLELGLLRFCHDTLQRHRDSPYSLGVVVATQLLSSPGERGILPLLCLPVSTLDTLHSAALGSSSLSPCVESVRLSLTILDLLLHSAPNSHQSSLLEWNLTHSYPHIVSNIASYIYHHGDTRIPIAATALLTQLCQTTPLSVFSCFGADAASKRDAFVSRLASRVENEELKRGVLELLTEAVSSQPALAELFLCIHTSSSKGQLQYSLGKGSCLPAVMSIVSSPLSPLLTPSLRLLRSLWHGRHDAVLHAVRGVPSFWKHVTAPLAHPPSLTSLTTNTHNELSNQLLAASHVMHIVAMEMYYVLQDRLDSSLQSILKEFVSKNGVQKWNKCLLYPADEVRPLTSVLLAQQQLLTGWKTFLMVASSNQPELFGVPSPSLVTSPPPHSPSTHILTQLLAAVESHLAAPVSLPTVSMATKLSILVMILIKKWSRSLPGCEAGNLIGCFSHMMPHVIRLDSTQASPLTLHLYTSVHLLLSSARHNRVAVETRFLLGLIPFLAHTLRSRHDNSKGPSHRSDIQAMCLLAEMVGGVSDWSPWLLAFRNESLIPLLIQVVDERLKLQIDESLIEAILGVFIPMATNQAAAEAIFMAGLLQVLSLPLCGCLDNKLNPAPLSSQVPGTPVLRPHPPTTWSVVWQLALRLAGLLCHTLSHMALPALLDLAGAHQHRITQALDVMETIHCLLSLETTSSALFFLLQLFHHRRQLHFSLPSFHDTCLHSILTLLAAVATILSRRATLKHIVKTMHAAGLLPSNLCPPPSEKGRGQLLGEEVWPVGLQNALCQLQSGLLSILLSCLGVVQNFSPSLSDIVMATGQLDRDDYPALFLPSLTPPTVDQAMPPSLGCLTACLSVGLELLKKLDQRSATPSKSKSPSKSSKSPAKSPRTLTSAEQQRQRVALTVMERAAVLCLGQAVNGHTHSPHDLRLMSKELANELSTFSQSLLLTLNRRSSSALSQAPPTSFQEAWSGRCGLSFSDTREQIVFRIIDSFTKQLHSPH